MESRDSEGLFLSLTEGEAGQKAGLSGLAEGASAGEAWKQECGNNQRNKAWTKSGCYSQAPE